MATEQLEVVEFAVIMAQECPGVRPFQLVELMKLARRHGRLQERACNEQVPENHDAACEAKIRKLCEDIGCTPLFSGDPRGATVKLKLPSGRTNDFGGIGVCVPQ